MAKSSSIRWRFWLPVAAVWVIYFVLVALIYTRHPNGAGDYAYYFRGAQRIISHTGLYANLARNDYAGPPLPVQLLAPIVAVTDFRTSSLIWLFLNIVTLLGTLALLNRYVTSRRAQLALWLAPLLFIPTFYSFWVGQLTVILFALTTGAWVAYKENKPALAGALLAIAVWTKFYPGLLILYFLWKRQWRVVIGAAITSVVVVVFQVLVSGLDTFIYYFTHVLGPLASEGQPDIIHSNNSVLGFTMRLFVKVPQSQPLIESNTLFMLARFGLVVVILGLTIFLISRPISWKQTSPQRFDLEYALVTLVALLLGATLWIHGVLSLLLAYFILLRTAPNRRLQTRLLLWSILSAVLINLHLFIILGYLRPPSENVLPALALSLPFFGTMIVWGMLVVRLVRQKKSETTMAESGLQNSRLSPPQTT